MAGDGRSYCAKCAEKRCGDCLAPEEPCECYNEWFKYLRLILSPAPGSPQMPIGDAPAQVTRHELYLGNSDATDRARMVRRKATTKMRAKRASAYVEDVSLAEIAEAAGWRCGICSGPVSKWLRFPHPESPTLDHILPLSKGGKHERSNAQLAHWRCNHRKGAKVDGMG